MDSHDIESYFRQHSRTLLVLLLAVGMAAVSGAFMAMRQTEEETVPIGNDVAGGDHASRGGVGQAPRYGEIAGAKWLANEEWTYSLDNLPREARDLSDQKALTPEELGAAIKARAERRAFDGAPPTVPHEIDQMSSASCLLCHGEGAMVSIGGKQPATISHPFYSSCTQCHVPSDGLRRLTEEESARLTVASFFKGKERAGAGSRAYEGAPPTVPHPLWMRQNCMSCHGPSREHAIKTSHPSRQNCLQCHAPDAGFDNREQILNTPPPSEP